MDEELIAIELEVFVEEGRPPNATDLALSEKMLDTLTTVVRASKKVNELIAVGKTFRLRLPPKLAADVSSGKLSMMQAAGGGIRSAIVNQKATIVGSGSFHMVAAAPLIAVAVWQLAAKITANHFLAEIDMKLAAINTKLDELLHVMHDRWKGELHGSARKLASISRELREHELSELEFHGFQVSIETIDTTARGITAQAQLRSRRALERVRNIDPKVTPRSDNLEKKTNTLIEALREIDDSATQEFFSLYVRALAAQVRCSMPSNPATTNIRLSEINDELRDAIKRNEIMLDVAREKIAWLKGLLTRETTDDKNRRQLLNQRRSIVLRSQQLATQVSETIQTVRSRLDAHVDRDIWVTIGADGGVTSAHALAAVDNGP